MLARVQHGFGEWWLILALVAIASALVWLPFAAAVALVGGGLALIAILRYPELALYALIIAVPFGSWFPIPVSAGNLTAVDLLVAAVLALWFARMIALDRAIRISCPPLTVPFVALLFAGLVSTTTAVSLQSAAKEWTKWFEMFAIYLLVANTVDGPATVRVLTVSLLAGMGEAVIGVYQFVFRAGPEGFALFGRFMRAYGTFEQPNPYAGYLGLLIPIALGILVGLFPVILTRARQSSGPTVHRLHFAVDHPIPKLVLLGIAAASLVVMLAALLMSWSRGAWLGVGAALVVVLVVTSRRAFIISVITAFVLTFVILLSSINIIPGAVAERFSGIGDYFGVFDVRGVKVDDANFAIVERMAHWQAAVEMFVDHPLTGVGFGNYATVYPAYALPRWSDPLGHAHNYYLNIAAEAGSIGLVAYLVLWGMACWQGWRVVRSSRGLAQGIAAGLLGMIVALAVHNAFDNLFVHGMAVQVGIGLGTTAAIGRGPMTGNNVALE